VFLRKDDVGTRATQQPLERSPPRGVRRHNGEGEGLHGRLVVVQVKTWRVDHMKAQLAWGGVSHGRARERRYPSEGAGMPWVGGLPNAQGAATGSTSVRRREAAAYVGAPLACVRCAWSHYRSPGCLVPAGRPPRWGGARLAPGLMLAVGRRRPKRDGQPDASHWAAPPKPGASDAGWSHGKPAPPLCLCRLLHPARPVVPGSFPLTLHGPVAVWEEGYEGAHHPEDVGDGVRDV
jgi:hypothetical protein